MAIVIADSYSESNQDTSVVIPLIYMPGVGHIHKVYQSFIAIAGELDSAKFYLKRYNIYQSLVGYATVSIFTHSGTYGVNSVGTGSALATADPFDVTTLTDSFELITFNFTGTNRILLTNGVYYVVAFEYDDGNETDSNISVGADASSSTHSGNAGIQALEIWDPYEAGGDFCFYVYEENSPTTTSTSTTTSSTSTTTTSTSTTTSSTSTTTTSISTTTTSTSTSTSSSTTTSTSTTTTSTSTTTTSTSTTTTSTSTTIEFIFSIDEVAITSDELNLKVDHGDD